MSVVAHGETLLRVNMFCQKGGSDKVYHLTVNYPPKRVA